MTTREFPTLSRQAAQRASTLQVLADALAALSAELETVKGAAATLRTEVDTLKKAAPRPPG